MVKYSRKRKLPITPCITSIDAPNSIQCKRNSWSRMLVLNSALLVCVFSGCNGSETGPTRISRNNSFVPERIKDEITDVSVY